MKRIARWIGIVVAILLLAVVALPFLIDANQFRPRLQTQLSKALAREVTIGDLKLSLFSGGVSAGEISIADDPAYSRAPFLYAKSLAVGVEVLPLIFSRQLHVTGITLDQPQIQLIASSGGWNFSSLGGKSSGVAPSPAKEPPERSGAPGLDLSVHLVKITNGRLSFSQRDSSAKTRELGNVNIELRDFAAGSAFPFSLSGKLGGGGDIQLNGTAGPINPSDAAQTPAKVNLKLSGFDLAAAGIGASGGLAGLLSIDGVAASNGKTLSLSGRLKAAQLKLAKNGSPARDPVQFDFALEHDLRRSSGVLRRGEIHIGSALASFTGSYTPRGDSTAVNMNLWGPEMPVPQLAAMLPALGVALPSGSSFQGGTANAKLSFTGPVDALVINGTLGLNNTRLTGFDLGSKMSAVEKLAGLKSGRDTEIQTFGATVHMAPGGSTIEDIKLVAPAIGELSGAGTISATQALDFKMRATLHTGGSAMAMLGVKGDTGVPFLVEGTASNPVFRPDIKGFASEKIQSLGKGQLGKTAGSFLDSVLGKKKKP